MNIKFKSLIAILLLGRASSVSGQQMPQAKPAWMTGSGISGPGLPVTGDGAGGWRSGSAGVAYKGANPQPGWLTAWNDYTTGSAVKRGVVLPIKIGWLKILTISYWQREIFADG